MSFAEIQKLKELLKTLQGSGEATTRVRMEVGRAIEQLQKERSVARMMAGSDVSQPFGLLESSFEKSSLLGERWKPPWDPTWNPLPTGIERAEQEILNPRAFDVNLNSYSPLGAQRRLTDREINKIVTSDLPQETKEIVIKKLEYRRNILDNAEREISGYTTTTEMERWLTSKRENIDSNIQKIIELKQSGTSIWSQKELDDMVRNQLIERGQIEKSISRMKAGLPLDQITSKKLESLDDSIYKMGATQWEEKKGIPVDWLNTNKAYETPTAIEQFSGSFFTGDQIPGTPGTDLLSFKDPKKILNKASIFTQKQWRDKEAAQQEIEFINNYLLDPEMAAEYAKTAPFSFFKYWSQKGGTLGLKEHMQSLKVAARADDVEPEAAKWGKLTSIKDVKSKDFTFASLRGQVTELWEPTSPRISQVGLLTDSSGESIKFTVWKNQQQNIPKVEKGKNYYFGNVASQEWQGRWNLNVNQFSAIEEISPMPFNTAPPLMIPGSKVELRDYSKPYSIDAKKGTITYTTKSGKVVEMPIQQAGKKDLVNVRLGDEPGDLAAFLPFAGLPFLMGNVTGGTAQIDSQQSMRMNTHPLIQESLTETYNDLGELGSIWGQKGSEVYPKYKERDADYRKEMAEGTMSPYRKYLPLDFGATILDVLGAGLYPLVYPQQALSGGAMGKTWMEGIREEVSPSKALGIEGTWTGLGADIVLDPLNLAAGVGLLSKFKKADSAWDAVKLVGAEVPEFLKNDEAVFGRTAAEHRINKKTVGKMTALRLNQKEMSTSQQVFLETQIRAESWNRNKPEEFFEKLYKESYEQVKSDYIAAEGITPEQFENIAKTDPTFADKMTTWVYSEYGRKTDQIPAAATIPKPKPATVAAESVPSTGYLSQAELKARYPDEANLILNTPIPVDRLDEFNPILSAASGSENNPVNVAEFLDEAKKRKTLQTLEEKTIAKSVAPVQVPILSRLEELSKKPFDQLSLTEKNELSKLTLEYYAKTDLPESTTLIQNNFKKWQEYNTDPDNQISYWLKDYKKKELEKPEFINPFYVENPIIPVVKPRMEELSKKPFDQLSMSERRELDDLIFKDTFLGDNMAKAPKSFAQDAAQISSKPPIIVKTAQTETDRISETTVEEIRARRESRGEITTPEQIEQIRELQREGVKETADYQARNADKKKFSWVNLGLGVGAGIATTSSFYSLPKEEQEANKEQVRQALMPSEEQSILGTAVDLLNMDSYIEGATILNAHAMLTGDSKRYDWKDRITPSMALGIQNKDTSLFSLRGAAGTVLDIAVAPTTYLSLGSGAAVKIGSVGGKGAKALKLSKMGVKELATFTKKYGEEMGTLEFAHHMEQNPAFQKKVLAEGGVNLRGWGQEMNLIPGSVFDPVTNAAKTGAMQFSMEHPTAFKKAVGIQEYLENKFVVRAAVKRLPRSSRLLPMEADYAEKAMLLPKKVRFDIAQGTERDIELAKEARKAFGENYEEIVSNLIEAPATRESAKLTTEQRAIVEELESYNKGFAAQEKELGLLDTEMSGYLRHTLTPEAKKYLEKGGKKVSTELYTPLSVENKFTTKRSIQGTVSEINERARKELGVDFDYFEANPFKATSIRRAESIQAVEQAKLLKWTVEKYGVPEDVARVSPDEYVQSSVDYIKGAWLPKPIAEDIEKEFVQRDTGAALQLYDKALNAWKYSATVTHPAYHVSNVVGGIFNNWLGEVDSKSYYRSSRLLLGGDKEKVFTTALGDQYTGEQLMKMAGESGILSQPGMMDIQKLSYEIADTQKEKAIELAKKGANAPITVAQYEENFIRLSLFNDRIMKGDTVQGARAWVSEFQFQYSKESFTPFERDYMKRAVPFYAWMRGNVPLMGKQLVKSPGKFAQFGKLNVAAVNGQELPQYTEGDLTWMYPGDESTGTFNYMRTPATDLDAYSDPLRYGFSVITPFAKYPLEKALGFNTYTSKDFDPTLPWYNPQNSAESNLIIGRTGRDVGTLSDVYEDRNAEKQGVKYLTGVGQAKTDIRKKNDTELQDAYRKYTGRPNDFTYEQRLQLMQRDKWASAQSGISGEFEQLQGGHVYPAVLGGPPLPWNYITQTREENLEWLSAQNYIENLPEREFQQEEAWGRVEQEYSTGVEEINMRTLDNRDRPENEAQKEKKRYDLRKSENIKMYNRQLNTVRAAIRSAEKDLRGEKKKVEDARAKGYTDPTSEAQIKVIEAALVEYRAQYEKVSGLRDAEQGKEFELPAQGTDLSGFQPMDIGGYDKYAVRYGKGPELAMPEDIEKLADLKKIAAYYAAMKSYAPVAGFRPGTPEEVKNRILFTRDPRYQGLAQIANPLISGAGWEEISGKNYIGPRNISEIRAVVEGSASEPEPMMGVGEPPAWYSDQQVSQEPGQTTGFDYNDPEFREVVREIVQETLSEGIVSD